MSVRLTIAKGAFAAAVGAMTLAGAVAAPVAASAQPYYDNGGYSDPCAQDKTNRAVAGGILGAIGGAVIGSNLAHGSSRTGAAVLGGAVGAAGGAAIGHSTSTCDKYYSSDAPPAYSYNQQYYDNNGYDDGDRYGGQYGGQYDNRYDNRAYQPRCTQVWSQVWFPDGTTQRDQVRACRDSDGRWRVAD